MSLAERIRNRRARLAIIGQGYVGLPRAVEATQLVIDTRNATWAIPSPEGRVITL